MHCVFCDIESVVFENDKAKCFYDKFPVNKGHMLIVPKRHCEDYFGLTIEEKLSIGVASGKCGFTTLRKFQYQKA